MKSFHHEIPKLTHRKDDIVKDFYQSFDPSWLWQEWERSEKSGRARIAGEGRHFRSYRIKGRGCLDLALNVAKTQFHRDSPVDRREWILLMQRLKKVSHPLLPPTEVLVADGEERLIVVQPFCEEAISMNEMPTIRPLLAELEGVLLAEGLFLDDYWQLRCCRGHPFVIDYSELKGKPHPKSRLTL